MKLLHVVPTYVPAFRYGGVVQAVHGLCRALARRGHEVTVFTSDTDGASRIAVPYDGPMQVDGVAVHYFRTLIRRTTFCPRMGRELERRMCEFDVVHTHSVFLWPTWAAARVARRHRVPYLVTPHGMLVPELVRRKNYWMKQAWIALVERRNLERAAMIHATSHLEAADLRRFGFRLPEIAVVPNGADAPTRLSPSDRVSPDIRAALSRRPVLLFLGRLNWKKGLDRLIQALARIPEATLVVAGNDEEGYLPQLQQLARACHVADRVTFVGAVDGPDKSALLGEADVFVLPSLSENFGIAVLEAMAHGCPVVVSHTVGLAEEVEQSGAGLVVDSAPEKLGGAIRELLDREQLRREMGRRGREAVAIRYSWDYIAECLERVLFEVVNRARTAERAVCSETR